MSSSSRPGVEQRVGELGHPGRVERDLARRRRSRSRGRRARPRDIDGVADRAGDRRGVVAAAGGRPEPDADRAAGGGDRRAGRPDRRSTPAGRRAPARGEAIDRYRSTLSSDAASLVARRRPAASPSRGRHRSCAAEACRSTSIDASIRSIISARPGQPALLDAVRGAAEGVVEEVARRHHPEARVGDDLDVGRVAVERVRALDGQQPGGDRPARVRAREVDAARSAASG